MTTELARALDEELAAHGVRADKLSPPDYAYALLVIQLLTSRLKDGDTPSDQVKRMLSRDPRLAQIGEATLQRVDYEVVRDSLRHFVGEVKSHPQGSLALGTALDRFLEEDITSHGLLVTVEDREALADLLRSRLARREAQESWERHLGALLTHQQVLKLTGWTKQALSQAVRDGRVLRLTGSDRQRFYPESAFNDDHPARPLPGAKRIFQLWADADPRGWTAAAWLVSPKVELDGRSPREVLLQEDADMEEVTRLARQAVQRLAT